MIIRNAYSKVEDEGIDCSKGGPSLTKQSLSAEMDINNIMSRYTKNGILPDLIKENAIYGDFSASLDYQQSMEVVLKAQEQFDALDASVRDRFKNDPVEFLAFAEDPKNAQGLIDLGLATARELPSQPATPLPEAKNATEGKSTP